MKTHLATGGLRKIHNVSTNLFGVNEFIHILHKEK